MFSFFKNTKTNISEPEITEKEEEKSPEPHDVSELMEDENGKYQIVKYWGKEERKTHIKGILKGKYRGEFYKEDASGKFYNFTIYESELYKVEKQDKIPPYDEIKKFPKEKLPDKISTCIKNDTEYYHIEVHHPQFTNRRNISQKLQQTEGNLSFGIIEGEIFGYILDEIDVEIEEKKYIPEAEFHNRTLEPTVNVEISGNKIRREYWYEGKTKTYWGNWENEILTKTNFRTGNKEFKNNYFREEFWYKGKNRKYWGEWKYRETNKQENIGCGTIFGVLLWGFLLFMFFPYLLYFLPFLIIGLIIYFFRPILKYLIWIIAVIFFIGFLSNIFNSLNSEQNAINSTKIKDDVSETRNVQKIKDKDNTANKDSLITHFRKWKDYENRQYEGKYSIKTSDLKKSKQYKNSLPFSEYGQFIHSLKENDKNSLLGLYQLFDRLKKEKKVNSIQFSEMIVSFVQDIPYALVLDQSCNPALYQEKFIKEYFKKKNAFCDPNQRFGINSPVEFLGNLKGDCDTRTLLLYTILDHYSYDVLLLSSNFYQHSILAIDQPSKGQKFNFYGKNYTVWETTNFLPSGIIPMEISDQNKWEITLKSKNNGKQ